MEITGFGAPVLPLLYRLSTGETQLVTAASGRLHRWDPDSGELLGEFQALESGAGDVPSMAVAVLPDGQVRIAAPDEDGLCLWDGVSGRLLREPDSGAHHLFNVAADGSVEGGGLLIGGGVGGVYRWDLLTGHAAGPVPEKPLGYVVAVATAVISNGVPLIVASSEDGQVHRWHAISGQPFGEPLSAPHIVLLRTAYLPDGRAVFIGAVDDGDSVCRWDAETGEEVGPMTSAPETVVDMALAVVSGRTRLFTVDESDTVRQWDLLTGVPIAQTFAGHAVSVLSSPEGGALLAVGTRDGRLTTHRLH
ncbi:WD40 repeat domain-containing protein [Streptomyces sp. NPDC002623]